MAIIMINKEISMLLFALLRCHVNFANCIPCSCNIYVDWDHFFACIITSFLTGKTPDTGNESSTRVKGFPFFKFKTATSGCGRSCHPPPMYFVSIFIVSYLQIIKFSVFFFFRKLIMAVIKKMVLWRTSRLLW